MKLDIQRKQEIHSSITLKKNIYIKDIAKNRIIKSYISIVKKRVI